MHVWFGDPAERELSPSDMYLAVYAAGGGKRNMANFVRQPAPGIPGTDGSASRFRTSDVHVYLSNLRDGVTRNNSQLFICRWASGRGEWVPKRIKTWTGANQLKLIPEWFKARFWDNKQEKKHPWFMFALLHEYQGAPLLFTSDSFPVHQYYPTGPKKTDPNDTACRLAFHKVLKQAPPTSLRPENLLRNAASLALADGTVNSGVNVRSPSPATPSPQSSATNSPLGDRKIWGEETSSQKSTEHRTQSIVRRKSADSHRVGRPVSDMLGGNEDARNAVGYVHRGKRAKLDTPAANHGHQLMDAAQVDAAQALLALRVSMPVR